MISTDKADDIYIGLMSGTSLDAVDAAAVSFSGGQPKLIGATNITIPDNLRKSIITLCQSGNNEIEQLGMLDAQLGELFASAVQVLLKHCQLNPQQIQAIGNHGQTLRHRPKQKHPFTLQIGSASIIAQRTGITTIADFRSRDIAAGGEGAPLVPAFHSILFDSQKERRCIVNIGGISNITYLSGNSRDKVIGFDCGPGNLLMNAWCEQHISKRYDDSGNWAASGIINKELLDAMLNEPFFSLTPPKSTGRELFNINWLDKHLAHHKKPLRTEDVQATLCELTAHCISNAIQKYATQCNAVYICGGGAHNQHLMVRLQNLVRPAELNSSKKIGLDPDWVEACAFAWLAKQTLERKPGNLPEVTGADSAVILGAIYPA